MASKLSFILSLGFFLMAMLLGGDLITIQIISSQLDAMALQVAHRISYSGALTQATIDYVEADGKTHIVSLSSGVKEGETYYFVLYRVYKPLILEPDDFPIAVKRGAIVGYY